MNIFENPLFCFENARNQYISAEFFTNDEYLRSKRTITTLKFEDLLLDNGDPLNFHNFNVNTGINLTEEKFLKLR